MGKGRIPRGLGLDNGHLGTVCHLRQRRALNGPPPAAGAVRGRHQGADIVARTLEQTLENGQRKGRRAQKDDAQGIGLRAYR